MNIVEGVAQDTPSRRIYLFRIPYMSVLTRVLPISLVPQSIRFSRRASFLPRCSAVNAIPELFLKNVVSV